ncbi:MAG: hypothetical protein WKF93_08255 [Acidimicrobiales bacterium]
MAADRVTVKKKCCNDRPRCKNCPVVWKRLSRAGYAEKVDGRRYVVGEPVPKRVRKLARRGATAAELVAVRR